jgi:hypothetical protein
MNVIAVAFLSTFDLKIYQNNIYFFIFKPPSLSFPLRLKKRRGILRLKMGVQFSGKSILQ